VEDEDFVPSEPVKGNAWYLVSSVMELVAGVFHAFFEFFDTLSSIAAARYVWEKKQRRFFEETSKDIEMIATGKFDATSTDTSRGERPRSAE
jgi:hypothetical protein